MHRTFREGTVGLLIFLGLGAFGGILLWLNRITPGSSSYNAIVEFNDVGGMQKGAPVRYRGVKVGSISKITTGVNAVEVEVEITNPNLLIPADSVIEANQSGLISESIINITPKSSLTDTTNIAKPLDQDCNPSLIICHQTSRLKGQIGISVDELIRQSSNFAAQYSNEEFYRNVNRLLVTSANAATSVAQLSREMTGISKSFKEQIGTFSNTAVTLQRATNQLTATTTTTADQFSTTARDFSTTAKQAGQLISNLDELLITNRSALVGTLNNITQTSNQLRQTVSSLSPAVNRLTEGELLKNFELLSANAAEASANLKDASKNLNDPKNLVLIQQTLDAARVTFENTQKITSDLDELTGNPKFRQNLLQLVNGLSKLVSSSNDVQKQTKVAMTLDSLKFSVKQPKIIISNPTAKATVNKSIITQPKIIKPTPTVQAIVDEEEQVLSFTPPPKEIAIKQDAVSDLIIPTPSPHKQELISPLPNAVEIVENNSANSIPFAGKSSQEKLLQQLREYGKHKQDDR